MSDNTANDLQQPVAIQPGQAQITAGEPETLYCVNHPNVETLLRCNRCGNPICLKCAQLTDVGYRCNDCIRGVQAAYFNAEPSDPIILFVTATVVSAIATPLAGLAFRLIPFFFLNVIFAFMLGGAAGGILVQILRRVVGKRRSRNMNYVAIGGIVLGMLISGLVLLVVAPALVVNLPLLIFAVLVIGTTFQLLR